MEIIINYSKFGYEVFIYIATVQLASDVKNLCKGLVLSI